MITISIKVPPDDRVRRPGTYRNVESEAHETSRTPSSLHHTPRRNLHGPGRRMGGPRERRTLPSVRRVSAAGADMVGAKGSPACRG